MRKNRGISSKVRNELATRNMKRNKKDYLIYFITLTFAVALFYTFHSIKEQLQVIGINDPLNYLSAVEGSIAGVSVIACMIVGFLVIYANQFLMKRRKKEFGVYMTLGMERRDIQKMILKETGRIGMLAFIIGIGLGVFASQILYFITARMMGISLTNYRFIFSIQAVFFTIFFFFLIHVILQIFNHYEIRRIRLIDLLQAEKENEGVNESKIRILFQSLFGIAALFIGYRTAFQQGEVEILKAFGVAIFWVGLGMVLLFPVIGQFVLHLLKKNRRFYYHSLHLFIVNQLSSRFKTAALSIGVVAVLLFFSMSIMSVSMGIGQSLTSHKEKLAPYDVSIIYEYDQKGESNPKISIEEELEHQGAKFLKTLEKRVQIDFYNENLRLKDVFESFIQTRKEQRELNRFMNEPALFIKESDYRRIAKLEKKPAINLNSGEYAILYNDPILNPVLTRVQSKSPPINIDGKTLRLKTEGIQEITLYDSNVLANRGVLVVSDEILDDHKPSLSILNGMYSKNLDDNQKMYQNEFLQYENFSFVTRADIQIEMISNQLITGFVGIYLSVIFLITASAVLAIQQLTQSTDNQTRYDMLYKQGADQNMLRKTLFKEVGIYFFVPLILAGINALCMTMGIYRQIPYVMYRQLIENILFSASITAVIFGAYFIITYDGCRRILKI